MQGTSYSHLHLSVLHYHRKHKLAWYAPTIEVSERGPLCNSNRGCLGSIPGLQEACVRNFMVLFSLRRKTAGCAPSIDHWTASILGVQQTALRIRLGTVKLVLPERVPQWCRFMRKLVIFAQTQPLKVPLHHVRQTSKTQQINL